MSKVVSMRLSEDSKEHLQRLARRWGRSQSEVSALLVEEGIRMAEFSHILFRDSSVGRQAYVQGSNLAVWEVVMVARGCDMNPARTAEHLGWPMLRVQAALKYAESYREEIDQAIEDNDSYGFDEITRMLPGTEIFVADGSKTAATKGQNKENLSPTAS